MPPISSNGSKAPDQQYNRSMSQFGILLDARTDLISAAPGHKNVCKNDIGFKISHCIQCGIAVGYRFHNGIFAAESQALQSFVSLHCHPQQEVLESWGAHSKAFCYIFLFGLGGFLLLFLARCCGAVPEVVFNTVVSWIHLKRSFLMMVSIWISSAVCPPVRLFGQLLRRS